MTNFLAQVNGKFCLHMFYTFYCYKSTTNVQQVASKIVRMKIIHTCLCTLIISIFVYYIFNYKIFKLLK